MLYDLLLFILLVYLVISPRVIMWYIDVIHIPHGCHLNPSGAET